MRVVKLSYKLTWIEEVRVESDRGKKRKGRGEG